MVTQDALDRIRYGLIETGHEWWDSAQAVSDIRALLKTFEKQELLLELILIIADVADETDLGDRIRALIGH